MWSWMSGLRARWRRVAGLGHCTIAQRKTGRRVWGSSVAAGCLVCQDANKAPTPVAARARDPEYLRAPPPALHHPPVHHPPVYHPPFHHPPFHHPPPSDDDPTANASASLTLLLARPWCCCLSSLADDAHNQEYSRRAISLPALLADSPPPPAVAHDTYSACGISAPETYRDPTATNGLAACHDANKIIMRPGRASSSEQRPSALPRPPFPPHALLTSLSASLSLPRPARTSWRRPRPAASPPLRLSGPLSSKASARGGTTTM